MPKNKYHYYVLVITTKGCIFVTSEPRELHNYVKWDKLEKPLEFTKEYARDVVIGLTCNGFLSYVIESKWKIENQPYMYEYGEMKFIKNEEDK